MLQASIQGEKNFHLQGLWDKAELIISILPKKPKVRYSRYSLLHFTETDNPLFYKTQASYISIPIWFTRQTWSFPLELRFLCLFKDLHAFCQIKIKFKRILCYPRKIANCFVLFSVDSSFIHISRHKIFHSCPLGHTMLQKQEKVFCCLLQQYQYYYSLHLKSFVKNLLKTGSLAIWPHV